MPLIFFQSLTSAPSSGVDIGYYTSIPENTFGKNGDVAIITTTRKHYKKITGIWTEQMGSVDVPSGVGVYSNKTTLLAAAGSSVNQLSIVSSEPGNMYLRNSDNTKWIVLSGNKYEEINLPSDSDFIIPSGTVIFNITTSKHNYE